MTLFVRRFSLLFFTASIFLYPMSRACAASPATCSVEPQDVPKVAEALKQMYVALTNDDMMLFSRVAATDFYAFDGGKQFNGQTFMSMVKAMHDAGRKIVWTVTEPQVHLACNEAWITYINRGSVPDGTSTKNVTWLESAFLHKEAGVWKIQFFHSTRAAQAAS